MIYIFFFLLLTYFILTHSEVSLHYAFHGLTIWYSKMVPALLPFMILSGTVIRMHLTEHFAALFHPLLKKIFRCSPNVSYGILMGFLCGFPMGAKTAADLLNAGKINKNEAEFLLAFCNNIGPVYFFSFIIPTLQITNIPFAFAGMYGLPLLYGIVLRYTYYRNKIPRNETNNYSAEQSCTKTNKSADLLKSLDESIRNGISSISMLCGYMVFFNLLNILPHFFVPKLLPFLAPLLEITGGILLSKELIPTYILLLLPFGGFSCIAQTNSMICNTQLSIQKYIIHKLILTTISAGYYLTMNSYI